MKRNLLLVSLLWGGLTYAQVGVGTVLPHPSAELQVFSQDGNKGVLIPEIALKGIEDKTIIKNSNPVEGLVVYNITEDEGLNLSKGFYYWGKVKTDESGLPVLGWNKLIGNDDLRKYVADNKSEIKFTSIEKDDLDGITEGFKLAVNGTEIGEFNESLTKFTIETNKYYVLVKDGETPNNNGEEEILVKLESGDSENDIPDNKKVPGYVFSDIILTKNEFVYIDETGNTDVYELKDVIENVETLTSLRLESNYLTERNGEQVRVPALVYKDEVEVETPVFLDRLFEHNESLTKLELNTDRGVLVYTDEKQIANDVDINVVVQSPWYKKGSTVEKAEYGDDIHTVGWVGIGYDAPSDAYNEKLRVNGSVTAVNSYYADYVFDAYFTGESSLKYDYKFNTLSTVENFIKKHNHLPGITPISELHKSDNGYSFNLSELSIQLLEKTEELYLHTIEQSKEIESLKAENSLLKERLETIELLIKEQLSK
ncbi:MAG: hypothetical protein LBI73_11405 [Myroides sp.]|jgi:hypothetical protein|nr:hypothetical protein [Myroides sp.]